MSLNWVKELNRNGKYQTVIRLFNKHEIGLSYNSNSKYLEKVRQQYEYAKENVDSLKKVANAEGMNGRATAEGYTNIIISKIFDFTKRLIYLGAAFIIFTLVFKNVIFHSIY